MYSPIRSFVSTVIVRRQKTADSTYYKLPHEVTCVNNPLDTEGNYSATSNNTKLVHWPLMGGQLHLNRYREEGPGQAAALPVLSSLYQM